MQLRSLRAILIPTNYVFNFYSLADQRIYWANLLFQPETLNTFHYGTADVLIYKNTAAGRPSTSWLADAKCLVRIARYSDNATLRRVWFAQLGG